jgi:hypothetical protein
MNRHPNDILRTIAHELTHYKQDTEHQLDSESGRTGSPIENEAHATAGIVMRHFNKQYPEYLNSKPITENIEWYKDLAAAKMGYNNHLAVPRNQLPVLNKLAQSIMDNPPSTMSPRDMARHQQTLDRRKMNLKAVDFFANHPDPDDEVEENFADGKGPGRPGDSQRHGIPKKATMAQLKKAAKAKGRKGQLARWQINMRNGKKK